MDRKSIIKQLVILLIALGMIFLLTGCRTRTTGSVPTSAVSLGSSGKGDSDSDGESISDSAASSISSESGNSDSAEDAAPGGSTKENPDAARKEYDENAPAEIVPGTDRMLHGKGEGNGASAAASEDTQDSVIRLNDNAEESATQTVAAQEAEEMGVSEDAEQADSAMTYFTVLLSDRMGSLFECQRANVYWETEEDHVTVFKTSPEHALILNAGAYDVSARLLAENLRVDDGWVVRKNPQVIVKIVDSSVLGSGVHSAGAARSVYDALFAREGWTGIDAVRNSKVLLLSRELLEAPHLQAMAMLMIAKTANPDLFSDIDPQQALNMLSEEATGTLPTGIYYYPGAEE